MRFMLRVLIMLVVMTGNCQAVANLQVTQDVIDWGDIYSGEQKDGVFVLHNSGDTPLVINKVRSSCGCTAALVSEKIIQPGDEANLRVHFNSKHFQGQVVKRVVVMSNDPQQQQRQFTLRANILSELVAEPMYLSLGAIQIGDQVVRTLILENKSDIPVQLNAVRSTSRHIRLDGVPAQLQPGEKISVQLTVTGPDSAGSTINGYILIDATGHTRTQMRLPVVARVAKKRS